MFLVSSFFLLMCKVSNFQPLEIVSSHSCVQDQLGSIVLPKSHGLRTRPFYRFKCNIGCALIINSSSS